jgi:hypothetical protein
MHKSFMISCLRKTEKTSFFIDELGFNASMRRRFGRAPIGQGAFKRVRALRTRNISVCCAMSKLGTLHYLKQNHPFNRESFFVFH